MEDKSKVLDNLKNKNISPSSLKLYLNNLKRLNGNQEIKNFNFLKDEAKIIDKIKDYKPNTRRTYLISIVSLLKQEPKFKKLYDKYYTMLMEYNKDLQVNNTKSESQTANWIEQSEVLDIFNVMREDVMSKLTKRKLFEPEYNDLLAFVVLSLYTLQPPRRNLDYMYMVITKKYSDDLDNKFNYLDLDKMEFHFNNFKTQKTYKRQSVPISPELQDIIKKYIEYHPLKSEIKKKNTLVPFLVNFKGEPFEAKNTITRILNKIFKKKIGVSMLRNIYLTDKYGKSSEEMKDDTTNMGTSVNTAQNNYIKIDG